MAQAKRGMLSFTFLSQMPREATANRHHCAMTTVDKASVHYRACNLCEAICGIEITVQADQRLDIRGDKDDPFSRGYICPKAVALQDLHYDKDRLKYPVREGIPCMLPEEAELPPGYDSLSALLCQQAEIVNKTTERTLRNRARFICERLLELPAPERASFVKRAIRHL